MNYSKSDETKIQLLEAAAKLFYDKGYNDTSVREICDFAGQTHSRINYHFNSKADLAGEIYFDLTKQVNESIVNALKPYVSDYLLLDEIHRRLWFRMLLEQPNLRRFYYQLACANIQAEPTVRSSRRYFDHEAEYLHTDIDPKFIKVYPYLSTGMVSSIMKAKYESRINLTNDDIIDLLSHQLARMFDINKDDWIKLSNDAKKHLEHMYYKMQNFNYFEISYENE